MHAEAYAYVQRTLERHPIARDARVLEIGGRNINGTIRDLFPTPHYLTTDILPGEGVDMVADGATLTLDAPVDVAVCCEVLEHAEAPDAIVANMVRLLIPGGRLIITAAGCGPGWARAEHSAYDGGPRRPGEPYANISHDDLTAWLSQCEDVDITVNPIAGDIYATAITADPRQGEGGSNLTGEQS